MDFKGTEDEKGKVTGIGRSIGALARAFGPIFSSTSMWIKNILNLNWLFKF